MKQRSKLEKSKIRIQMEANDVIYKGNNSKLKFFQRKDNKDVHTKWNQHDKIRKTRILLQTKLSKRKSFSFIYIIIIIILHSLKQFRRWIMRNYLHWRQNRANTDTYALSAKHTIFIIFTMVFHILSLISLKGNI